MNETKGAILGFVRRWWLLLLLTTIVAAGVAGIIASGSPSTHTASVTLEVDTLVLQRWPELGGIDRFLRALRSEGFADAVSQAAGLEGGLGDGTVSAYSLGEPPNRVVVTFTAASAEDVEAVARVLGDQAVDYFREINAATFERQETLLDNDRATLEAMASLKGGTSGFDRLNAEYLAWSVKNVEVAHATQMRELEGVCRMVSGPVVSETKPKAAMRDAIGAGLLGLVAGVGIAYGADFLASRRRRA